MLSRFLAKRSAATKPSSAQSATDELSVASDRRSSLRAGAGTPGTAATSSRPRTSAAARAGAANVRRDSSSRPSVVYSSDEDDEPLAPAPPTPPASAQHSRSRRSTREDDEPSQPASARLSPRGPSQPRHLTPRERPTTADKRPLPCKHTESLRGWVLPPASEARFDAVHPLDDATRARSNLPTEQHTDSAAAARPFTNAQQQTTSATRRRPITPPPTLKLLPRVERHSWPTAPRTLLFSKREFKERERERVSLFGVHVALFIVVSHETCWRSGGGGARGGARSDGRLATVTAPEFCVRALQYFFSLKVCKKKRFFLLFHTHTCVCTYVPTCRRRRTRSREGPDSQRSPRECGETLQAGVSRPNTHGIEYRFAIFYVWCLRVCLETIVYFGASRGGDVWRVFWIIRKAVDPKRVPLGTTAENVTRIVGLETYWRVRAENETQKSRCCGVGTAGRVAPGLPRRQVRRHRKLSRARRRQESRRRKLLVDPKSLATDLFTTAALCATAQRRVAPRRGLGLTPVPTQRPTALALAAVDARALREAPRPRHRRRRRNTARPVRRVIQHPLHLEPQRLAPRKTRASHAAFSESLLKRRAPS